MSLARSAVSLATLDLSIVGWLGNLAFPNPAVGSIWLPHKLNQMRRHSTFSSSFLTTFARRRDDCAQPAASANARSPSDGLLDIIDPAWLRFELGETICALSSSSVACLWHYLP